MMDIQILSRGLMERFLSNHLYREYRKIIIISIRSSDEQKIQIPDDENILGVLHLNFDDVTDNIYSDMIYECPNYVISHNLKLMSYGQAKIIADFVKEFKDKADICFVHCSAGVSRSAGVGAAISKYLTDDDSWVFNSPIYYPNMWCYRLTLNALFDGEIE